MNDAWALAPSRIAQSCTSQRVDKLTDQVKPLQTNPKMCVIWLWMRASNAILFIPFFPRAYQPPRFQRTPKKIQQRPLLVQIRSAFHSNKATFDIHPQVAPAAEPRRHYQWEDGYPMSVRAKWAMASTSLSATCPPPKRKAEKGQGGRE